MITIGVPAYNEQDNLRNTVNTILRAADLAKIEGYEILIVNDGSKDKTEEVIKELEKKHKEIRAIHLEKNQGLGNVVKVIIQNAAHDKLCFVPGDDILSLHTVFSYFVNAYKADLVFVFFINRENRSKFRMLLSMLFNLICTSIFNVYINYLNGSGVYSTKFLRSIKIQSKGYFISAEMNLKILLKGGTFYEMPGYLKTMALKSSAIRLSNFFDVCFCFLRLLYQVYISQRKEFSFRPTRIIDKME
jgi:dolichol-phosphate mannosyltransferase